MVCILPPKAFCTRDSKLTFLLAEALVSSFVADEVGVDVVVVDVISVFEVALVDELLFELFEIGNVVDEVADVDDEVAFAASCE